MLEPEMRPRADRGQTAMIVHCLFLLVLCYVWHRVLCRRCYRQECRDVEGIRKAVLEVLRVVERKARRAV